MKKEFYRPILSILILSQSWIAFPQSREPACDTLYPPSCFYQADTGMMPLIICPPLDSLGYVPDNLIGYNLYRDGEFVSYLPYPAPIQIEEGLQPGTYFYVLCAVYDLTPCGFPGETGESECLITQCIIRYGYPLDFLENWNSGSFETNNWTIESENWTVNGQFGNPLPTAEFTWDPLQTNYDIGLESYPLMADSMFAGRIYLDFDIKLEEYLSTGTEMMVVNLWDWESQNWMAIDTFSNSNGSFDWMPVHLDISEDVLGKVFKIKFTAKGEASLNILSWFIDNIHVYRECEAPFDLELEVTAPWETFKLTWEYPDTNYSPQRYGIYRSDDGEPWFLRDTSQLRYYYDDSVCMTTGKLGFQYKVTAYCIEGNDSCESDYSNEVMEVCEGIYEDEAQFILHIYPNPASDILTVESSESINLISLYNYDGRMIFNKEIDDRNYTLQVGVYPEGVYLLRVETGKGVVSRKIVLMR